MKIDPYFQRQRCNPFNVHYVPCVDLPKMSSLGAFIYALLSCTYLSVSWAFLYYFANDYLFFVVKNNAVQYSSNVKWFRFIWAALYIS